MGKVLVELGVGAHGIEPWTSFLSGTRSTTEPRTPVSKIFAILTWQIFIIHLVPKRA
ncbi:MAG: hypothetical protein UT96_C0034G0002 [Candidatus Woesebacteria bacterium GW2011_GWC2_40_30]|nr:MAG: hypothetical protein UT96_C0034G0002 [Candidatus Woesebacteria bacterium GW2011_GWC2_40_30]